jgi:hypothetical protein
VQLGPPDAAVSWEKGAKSSFEQLSVKTKIASSSPRFRRQKVLCLELATRTACRRATATRL